MATHVALSRRSLERRFRSTLGRTVAGEIACLRVERCKRQLLASDQPVKSIGFQNGFRSARQFCTVFRRIVGTSPEAWRKARKEGGVAER